MKLLDLLRMSSSNLWKRKVRTVLTVLGVVIGVASIVVLHYLIPEEKGQLVVISRQSSFPDFNIHTLKSRLRHPSDLQMVFLRLVYILRYRAAGPAAQEDL